MMTIVRALVACVGLTAAAGVALGAPAIAADRGLAGAWSGGGTVTFGGGSAERARCRAVFTPVSKTAYSVSATCATPSGKVSQSATVRGSGSSYRGTFYNADYDTSGSISISYSGNSQTVRLNGTKASAVLSLHR